MPYFWLVIKAIFSSNHTTDSLDTVKQRLASKEAVLIDVRELNEWNEGHLEDARLVPLSEIRDPQKREAGIAVANAALWPVLAQ
jgi:rhodanese-related sulfurtransferase